VSGYYERVLGATSTTDQPRGLRDRVNTRFQNTTIVLSLTSASTLEVSSFPCFPSLPPGDERTGEEGRL
jgi:hypothetical protein